MNERELLRPLRERTLPAIPAELTAKIRSAARERLGRGHVGRRRPGAVLSMAAVVVLCVSHLGWTAAFLWRVQARSATGSLLR